MNTALRIKTFLLPLLVGLTAAVSVAAQTFLPGMEDVPLMERLTLTGDTELVFDSPAGRIVDVYAQGDVSRDAVLQFYRETLPELGWTPNGPAAFSREQETLTLGFTDEAGALTVRFSLAPQHELGLNPDQQ